MKVAVIGTGYVGLVSGVCLAAKGHDVYCVDIKDDIVAQLNKGEPHIHESGLESMLKKVLLTNHFSVTTDLMQALDECQVAMIAVGTPSDNGIIDLTFVRDAAKKIGLYMKESGRKIVTIVKSTVVPGTTDTVVKNELENASGMHFPAFGLGMNPEFLREGEAIDDFMEPDRIVLGYDDSQSLACLEELYEPWTCDKVRVNTRTAELIKYANNAILATQISATNEIANLAAALGGIDAMDVVHGVTLDKRWSPVISNEKVFPPILTYLKPGCGFGGSCFSKDIQAIRSQGVSMGLEMNMLNAVLAVNENQHKQVFNLLVKHAGPLSGKNCLILGLAFKPGTDDVRESVSLKIVESLIKQGAKVVAHDPIASSNFVYAQGISSKGAVDITDDWISCINDAKIIILATAWDEYKELVTMNITDKIIFDARRMFLPTDFPLSQYLAIGRSTSEE